MREVEAAATDALLAAYQAVARAEDAARLLRASNALRAWDDAVAELRVAGACWNAWTTGAGRSAPKFAYRLMGAYRLLATHAHTMGFPVGPSEVGAGL